MALKHIGANEVAIQVTLVDVAGSAGADLSLLTDPTELELIKRLLDFPGVRGKAAELRALHLRMKTREGLVSEEDPQIKPASFTPEE